MNYLNEAADAFKSAISFAAGRPKDSLFTIEDATKNIPVFLEYLAHENECSLEAAQNLVSQYGPTGGLIRECIAKLLVNDEGFLCDYTQIMLTCGAQEAMFLSVPEICCETNDVLLVRDPTYIGITGVADLTRTEIWPLPVTCCEEICVAVEIAVKELRNAGKRPRAIYLIPDFDNPSGELMSRSTRFDLINVCRREDIIILEDNPYGMFGFDGQKIPSIFAMSGGNGVVYFGTFSKTLCPALRVGYLVLPRKGSLCKIPADLMHRIERRKSFASLNTSQINQAAIGGTLISQEFSLARQAATAMTFYRENYKILFAELTKLLSRFDSSDPVRKVSGGFFLTVQLPNNFRKEEMILCAEKFGVLVMPVSFFSFNTNSDHVARFSFSNVDPDKIKEGVRRFGAFYKYRYLA